MLNPFATRRGGSGALPSYGSGAWGGGSGGGGAPSEELQHHPDGAASPLQGGSPIQGGSPLLSATSQSIAAYPRSSLDWDHPHGLEAGSGVGRGGGGSGDGDILGNPRDLTAGLSARALGAQSAGPTGSSAPSAAPLAAGATGPTPGLPEEGAARVLTDSTDGGPALDGTKGDVLTAQGVRRNLISDVDAGKPPARRPN